MRFLIQLMQPSGVELIVFNRSFSEVGALVSNDGQGFDVRQALHDHSEVADSVLRGGLIHLVEIGAETGRDHVDLSFLHSVRDRGVVFQETSLLIVVVAKKLKLSLEGLQLFLEAGVWVDYATGFSNSQDGGVEGQSEFVHQESDDDGWRAGNARPTNQK